MGSRRKTAALLTALAIVCALLPRAVFAAAYESNFTAQFNAEVNADVGDIADLSDYGEFPSFEYGEEVAISLDFGAPVAFTGNFAAVNTSAPYPGSTGIITSLKLDGDIIDLNAVYLSGEGIDGGLRLTICNKWNEDIEEQPVDVGLLPQFTAIEIGFIITEDNSAENSADELNEGMPDDVPAFDPFGVYNAYLGVQYDDRFFRNAWDDKQYGKNGTGWDRLDIGNNFNGLTGHIDDYKAVKLSGYFNDVKIQGNGTYRVELYGAELTRSLFFNQIFVSTDIPRSTVMQFTDVKILMDGVVLHTFDEGVVLTESNRPYYTISIIKDADAETEGEFSYRMPSSGTVAVEFTVNGFGYDNKEQLLEDDDMPDIITVIPDYSPGVVDYVAPPAPAQDDVEEFPVIIVVIGFVGALAAVLALYYVSNMLKKEEAGAKKNNKDKKEKR